MAGGALKRNVKGLRSSRLCLGAHNQPTLNMAPCTVIVLVALWMAAAPGWLARGDACTSSSVAAVSDCSPALFVFGASLVDVGQNAACMPFRSYAEFPPYGVAYFGKPMQRFSNGRLFIDFVSQALGQDLLQPYFKTVGANFIPGVCFASSGATAENTTVVGDGSSSSGLFSLLVQIDQFRVFRSSIEESGATTANMPYSQRLAEGIYIMQIGNNDYLHKAFRTPDFDPVATVRAVMTPIATAIKGLNDAGGRNIVVTNVMPLGCMPVILANFQPPPDKTDEYGCMIDYNELVQLHNTELELLLNKLREEMQAANLLMFDIYGIYWDAITNPSKYGLTHTIQACCGVGGPPYNYRNEVHCGTSGYLNGHLVSADSCPDPDSYMIWDSVHGTDAFNYHIAQAFLTGEYMLPPYSIQDICRLSQHHAHSMSAHAA